MKGGGLEANSSARGDCRVLSKELVEKVETESDTGDKNKSLGEPVT